MGWAVPQYSHTRVDQAGKALAAATPQVPCASAEIDVVNNWRSSHCFPLNAIQVLLRKVAAKVQPDATIAQRIKRRPSIERKLRESGSMRLSQMQDIGGCRAIVDSLPLVMNIAVNLRESKTNHELVSEDDYIKSPKGSGYRGYHIVYRYNGRKPSYVGSLIEIQLRTYRQHTWATAVEVADTFLGQSLRASGGDPNWKRFFALMATVIALQENADPVPDTPSDPALLREELRHLANSLQVEQTLRTGLIVTLEFDHSRLPRAAYRVIELWESLEGNAHVTVESFAQDKAEAAFQKYAEVEAQKEGKRRSNAVLIAVESWVQLKRAYPNYLGDVEGFLDEVKVAIS